MKAGSIPSPRVQDIRMTNNIRVFLWLALGLALYLNYSQWQLDYGPKPASTTAATGANGAPKPSSLADNVPQVTQPAPETPIAPGAAAAVPSTTVPSPSVESPSAASSRTIRITTDVLVLDIDLSGGALVRAELRGYPVVKGKPDPMVLLNRADPATNYVLLTGLSSSKGADACPSHLATFASEKTAYQLAPGQDELRVSLTCTDGAGLDVTKTFVFHRSSFHIGLEYVVANTGTQPIAIRSYSRIVRTDPAVERSMFKVESFAFRGPAMWAPNKAGEDAHFQRLDVEETGDHKTVTGVTNGWLAGMQHHFVSVVLPDKTKPYDFSLGATGREYVLGALGPVETVAAGKSATVKEDLFVGPKLQKQLKAMHDELDHVADYGVLTLLARPLFILLNFLHSIVHNWGVAIILATFLLKLLFYPLSEKSGKSMARMRELAPRMKQLQETYKDDRTKLGQATMELYKQEKVNPVAGCLPMLIQMPVFLAFYWVLLESVEMRQAPFFGWINDLSARDPFFILPALNGLAMWIQYKLNPPPPDPMQAKVFQFMPLVFSVLFAVFPAGLVLYWVTNTGLSILQQWNINRKIAAEKASRKR
jgi:YidC/Oxa1 family membrane protein insertase